jgi:alpha,alpha-trehalase
MVMSLPPFGWKCLGFGLIVALSAASRQLPEPGAPSVGILEYIRRTWAVLTRSHATLALAAVDPKFKSPPDGRWPVYVAATENLPHVAAELREQMAPADFGKILLRPLPPDVERIAQPGLLYLPLPYVVPGGRFNEMYGWDSYFIQMGLLRDGALALARDMADNAAYEIREYGKILNANRTYYLTRSQPPFFTAMALAVYQCTGDRQWLAGTLPAIEQYYGYWTSEPHLTPPTGLSRYYDIGHGPAPEVISSELDRRGRTDYDLVRAYFRKHHIADYDVSRFYNASRDQLTEEFYQADRSMRESGFDPSYRFGPFSADIVHYNPVCLNSLLYLMEIQTAEILEKLDRGTESQLWKRRAQLRAAAINRLMWDEKNGLYFDYDFVREQVRPYPFLTTFFPLWAGIASPQQAARVVGNLALFERTGGLQTSTYQSGDQWDAPYGWAPLQWIAVAGMRRYGFQKEAERVSLRFLTTVLQQYLRHGVIVEKYDVVRPGANVGKGLLFGYHTNEVGFGWTNAVYTALFDSLSAPGKAALQKTTGHSW